MFLLISDFSVLDFCELYSDVHCSIILKLNLTEAHDTLEVVMMIVLRTLMKKIYKNLQFITGKPVWCKTMEDEYYFYIR